jgi:hypothetical protein
LAVDLGDRFQGSDSLIRHVAHPFSGILHRNCPPDIPGRMQGFIKSGAPWHMDGTIYMQLPAGLIPFF